MFYRRVAYLALLAGTTFYYIFDSRYFSWLLLILVVLLPIASILVTLPFLFRKNLKIESDAVANGAENLYLTNSAVLISTMRVQLQVDNLFYGMKERHKFTLAIGAPNKIPIPLDFTQCGLVRCSFRKAKMLDFMGLIYLPVPKPKPAAFLIPPPEIPYTDELPETLTAGYMGQGKAAPIETAIDREKYDIRAYRAGDMIRDIHWKLTARYNQPVIREYEKQAENSLYIAVLWAGAPDMLKVVLGRLAGFTRLMAEREVPYKILWVTQLKEERVPHISLRTIPSEEAMEAFFWDILGEAPPAENQRLMDALADSDYMHNNPVLLVTYDEIRLINGLS